MDLIKVFILYIKPKEQTQDMDRNKMEEQNQMLSNKYYFANPDLIFQKTNNTQGYNFMEKSNILDKIELQKGLEAGDIGI